MTLFSALSADKARELVEADMVHQALRGAKHDRQTVGLRGSVYARDMTKRFPPRALF